MFLFPTADPSSKRLGTSIICRTIRSQSELNHHPIISNMFVRTKMWRAKLLLQKCTFKASSSKHCSTFSLVLALHSRNKDPSSFASVIPSSLLTALSESWNVNKSVAIQWSNGNIEKYKKTGTSKESISPGFYSLRGSYDKELIRQYNKFMVLLVF